MTIVFPKNNLPTSSQPWAREVQKQLANVIASDRSNEINNSARDNQLNSSLISLSRVVSDVKAASDEATAALNGLIGLGSAGSEYTLNASNITAGTITGERISGGTISGVSYRFLNTSGNPIGHIFSQNDSVGSPSIFVTYSTVPDINSGNLFKLNNSEFVLSAGSANMGKISGASGSVAITTVGADGGIVLSTSGNNSKITLAAPNVSLNAAGTLITGNNLRSGGTLGRIALEGGGTTGASINNTGNLIRTTSSKRYKQDIGELAINYEDLLLLSPKKFRLKEEVIGSEEIEANKNARYYAGFIAEEIAETPLDIFVSYEKLEDGTSRPEGVYYAELTAALLAGIKHQDTLIKSLNERITTLENGAH